MSLTTAPLCHRRNTCRLCDSRELELVFSLEPTPPANAFLTATQIKQNDEERFPLDVFFCKSCHHVQLLDIVRPDVLFENYVYVSGTSPAFVDHFKRYSETLVSRFGLDAQSSVIEVGSNDGTLLRFFKDRGMKVLGIDPAKEIAKSATEAGIPTRAAFFDSQYGEMLSREFGQANAVIANNVFAHIDDLKSVATGIRSLLKPNGVYVFEVSYLVDVFQKTLFDTIYHEHLCYHAVEPLKAFFDRLGLDFFDAERVDSHGGSLRGYVQLKNGPWKRSGQVEALIEIERSLGLDRADTYKKFAGDISRKGKALRERLLALKKQGKKIGGFGAPAKATTLMHHFGIGSDVIDFIIDDSPLKQGLYSPGLHLPVVSSQAIAERKPDYLVVLAWNFADPIIRKHPEFIKNGGHFIVPLPELREV